MDRIRTKQKALVAVVMFVALLVTLSTPASAAASTAADVNESYHAQLPPSADGYSMAADGYANGSSMYDKWCALPNFILTYNGIDYNQSLYDFTDGLAELDKAVLNPLEAIYSKSVYGGDSAEWAARCGGCHIGGGGINDMDEIDIQCEYCHSTPTPDHTKDGAYLGDTSCYGGGTSGGCHQAGSTAEVTSGKDKGKRGMMFDVANDVHAGNATFEQLAADAGYGDNTCLVCHTPGGTDTGNTHDFARGYAIDTSMEYSSKGTIRSCDDPACHDGPHVNEILNQHTDTLDCKVCHTKKPITTGGSLSNVDWTKVNSVPTKAAHDLEYMWYAVSGGDSNHGHNPAMTVEAGVTWYLLPIMSDYTTYKDVAGAKIAPFDPVNVDIFVYKNTVTGKEMSIDRDLLFAADNATAGSSTEDNSITIEELQRIGFTTVGDFEVVLNQETVFFNPHNIDLGGSLGNPYTCDDCHVESGGILDFTELGIGNLVDFFDNATGTVGVNNTVHTWVVPEGTVITPNDCSRCHGEHVPTALVPKTMVNTTKVPAPTGVGDFTLGNVKLTDINGDVINLTDSFVPTRYDIDFGTDTLNNVGLKIRDVYLDESSIISATVVSTTKPKDLSPDMIEMAGTLFDVSVDSSLDGVRYTVTIGYESTDIPSEYGAQHLRMFHYNSVSDEWEDCTTAINTNDNTVTGTTTSLSPFVVAVWPDATTATSFSTVGMMSLMGLFAVFVMYISKRRDE